MECFIGRIVGRFKTHRKMFRVRIKAKGQGRVQGTGVRKQGWELHQLIACKQAANQHNCLTEILYLTIILCLTFLFNSILPHLLHACAHCSLCIGCNTNLHTRPGDKLSEGQTMGMGPATRETCPVSLSQNSSSSKKKKKTELYTLSVVMQVPTKAMFSACAHLFVDSCVHIEYAVTCTSLSEICSTTGRTQRTQSCLR